MSKLPSALRRQGRIEMLDEVPALLVEPEPSPEYPCQGPPPLMLWIHGRQASKTLDPGRYLRLMRSGIAACAVDLPGHGQRYDERLQAPSMVMEIVGRMIEEVDGVLGHAVERLGADPARIGIGGISAGGMVTLARLCRPHACSACVVEATCGAWGRLGMFRSFASSHLVDHLNPATHLEQWRPIPLLAMHCRADQWMPFSAQWRFLDAVEALGAPGLVERVAWDRTGAPAEHAGFGRYAAQAKEHMRRFLSEHFGTATPGASAT